MLRKPQAGDWAADDDDGDVEIAPIHMPQQQQQPSAAERSSSSSSSAANARSGNSRQEKSVSSESEPPRNRWGRTPEEVQAGGRRGAGSDSRGDYNRSGSGGYDRDARRDGGYGGARDFDRRDGGDRYGGGGGGYNSRSDDRYGGRSDDRYGGRSDDRYGGRNDYGSRNDDRYGGREPRRQHVEAPLEQGVVVGIKESFGFVSSMDRDGDLFFHITEAPVDVQVHDEVEFRVRFNQRSGKEVASQLVLLPKGTIVLEDVSDEVFGGVVTRGLRSSGPSHGDARQQRDESHGLIELAKATAAAASKSESAPDATTADSDAAAADATKSDRPAVVKRNTVRFTLDSVNAPDAASDAEQLSASADAKTAQPQRRKKPVVPAYGDEVQFRIATHRKTGARRAVELVVTASAKAKLELAIEAKLATLVRECGVVDKLKAGGGYIKCCDRPDDVYFPLHEIRASDDAAVSTDTAAVAENSSSGGGDAAADVSDKKAPSGRKQPKKPTLHEGDEVSFFVYEERDDESSRARPRLTALRVQRLPKGSVTFETLVRSNVAGVVSKTPKEPRNNPEVIGSITPTADSSAAKDSEDANGINSSAAKDSETTTTSTESELVAPGSKKSKESKKKNKSAVTATTAVAVPFRLSDTHDMGYIPGVGDTVMFDEVVEKRNGQRKAVNVRLVALNTKNRERGVVTSLRDEFGFIKCADRPVDAYFRFSDVLATGGASPRGVRLGTEVAFDVSVDPSKGDNVRAMRVELLPSGSVQWEKTVADGVAGEVIAVPGNAMAGASSRGGSSGGRGKGSLKIAQGRIRLAAGSPKFWLDYLPELKVKIDSKFVDASATAADDAPAAADTVATSAGDGESDATPTTGSSKPPKSSKELRLLFPASLSNAERFVIHQYCDALAISHQSAGDGASRRLELVASRKVPALSAAAVAALPALELEFRAEDVAEVRYSPRVGDRVVFTLAQATRTKQLQCKAVVCVEAVDTGATSKKKTKGETLASTTRSEGFIVLVRNEGFGFIQPAVGSSGPDENLFFHIKEVTTGEQLEALKPGMEVQYTPTYDDVKQKTRAVQIAVVPPGTIQKPVAQVLRGVVTRPSLLQPLKGKASARGFGKSGKAQPMSTIGKIRAVTADGGDADKDEEGDDKDDDKDDDGEEGDAADGEEAADAAETGATGSDTKPPAGTKTAPPQQKKVKAKTTASSLFAYNLKDVVDPSVVLREGDEVEFTVAASTKGPRASKIRVVALHAKQGVVLRVHEDLGGVIRVDSAADAADSALEIPFAARHVLRGDVLCEGDRVEFAHSMAQPDAARKIGTAAAAAAKAEAETKAETNAESKAGAEVAAETAQSETVAVAAEASTSDKAPERFVGQALSVLRISAAPAGASAEPRVRAPRVVNSSLLQAMRQVGASAVVASRMAKGPDGTRGFKDGWRAELLTAEATSDAAASAGDASGDGAAQT